MENSIIKKYTDNIMSAIKSGDRKKAEVYKLIKAKMMEFVTQKNAPELNESAEVTILNKMVKERTDTAEVYKNAGRNELAEQELYEASVISEHLPKAATEEDVTKECGKYIIHNPDTTMKDMGKMIKYIKSQFTNVDGGMVAKIVKEVLNGK